MQETEAGTVDEDWEVLLSFPFAGLPRDTGALKRLRKDKGSTTCCGLFCCISAADTRCGRRWFAPDRGIWRTCGTWHC